MVFATMPLHLAADLRINFGTNKKKIWPLVGRAAEGNHEFPPFAFAHAALFLCRVAAGEELFYHL